MNAYYNRLLLCLRIAHGVLARLLPGTTSQQASPVLEEAEEEPMVLLAAIQGMEGLALRRARDTAGEGV